jgi:hypothetical protein
MEVTNSTKAAGDRGLVGDQVDKVAQRRVWYAVVRISRQLGSLGLQWDWMRSLRLHFCWVNRRYVNNWTHHSASPPFVQDFRHSRTLFTTSMRYESLDKCDCQFSHTSEWMLWRSQSIVIFGRLLFNVIWLPQHLTRHLTIAPVMAKKPVRRVSAQPGVSSLCLQVFFRSIISILTAFSTSCI